MYQVRLTYNSYSSGVLLSYETGLEAGTAAAAIVGRAEPVNGEELMAIITKIPEAPEAVPDSNEVTAYDPGYD